VVLLLSGCILVCGLIEQRGQLDMHLHHLLEQPQRVEA